MVNGNFKRIMIKNHSVMRESLQTYFWLITTTLYN